jgi:hypothetical protein
MRPKTKSRLTVAYHEAGHALADYRLGFKIKQVSIVSDHESAGRVLGPIGLNIGRASRETPSSHVIARAHDKLIAFLAGAEAQRKFRPQSLRPYMTWSDEENQSEILFRLFPENEHGALMKYLLIKTRNLVNESINWGMIQDLAKTLMQKRTMSGEEVTAVFRASFQRQMLEWRGARKPMAMATA